MFISGFMLICINNGPSKEEIISRARDYGMVFREEVLTITQEETSGKERQTDTRQGEKPVGGDNEVIVTIPPGAGLEEISIILEKMGVVNAAAFEAEVRRQGVEQKLKAGSYYFPRGDVKEIVRRLIS